MDACKLSDRRERFRSLTRGSERIERGHHATPFVRHTRKAKAHLNSTQCSSEHEIVEMAEMANSKHFARKFGEACAQRHIEILEDDCSQSVGVMAVGQNDSRQ